MEDQILEAIARAIELLRVGNTSREKSLAITKLEEAIHWYMQSTVIK